jgi:hypothetical protein
MLQPICSDSPSAKSQTAICGGKDNNVAVVCVAKLGWREQMISDEQPLVADHRGTRCTNGCTKQ